jgi:hypothetical protein
MYLQIRKQNSSNEITYIDDIFNGAFVMDEGHILVMGGPNLKTFGLLVPQRNN